MLLFKSFILYYIMYIYALYIYRYIGFIYIYIHVFVHVCRIFNSANLLVVSLLNLGKQRHVIDPWASWPRWPRGSTRKETPAGRQASTTCSFQFWTHGMVSLCRMAKDIRWTQFSARKIWIPTQLRRCKVASLADTKLRHFFEVYFVSY